MSLSAPFGQEIFAGGIKNIFYFPVWWYSRGLKNRVIDVTQGIRGLARSLALKIMFTHLFSPMFGETSFSGRVISFVMRCLILVWRTFLFILGAAAWLLLLAIWVGLPVLIVWQIVRLLQGSPDLILDTFFK